MSMKESVQSFFKDPQTTKTTSSNTQKAQQQPPISPEQESVTSKNTIITSDNTAPSSTNIVKKKYRKLNRMFSIKELFDRVGFGFASPQFVTILFFIIGAPAFLVGIINGVKDVLSSITASLIKNQEDINPSKQQIASAGIIFGFSLIILVLAIRLSSIPLYSLAVIVGGIAVVIYGEFHNSLLSKAIRFERRGRFLKGITRNGLIITTVLFVVSGILFEVFGMKGTTIEIFSKTITVSGYFISFEIAAIACIISGFILSKIRLYDPKREYKNHFKTTHIARQVKQVLQTKYAVVILIASLVLSLVETLGASYYGYFIFKTFEHQYAGGFLNIAIIFGIALIISSIGPMITRWIHKTFGLAPLVVFGSLMMAILPLVLITNTYFFAVISAVCAMVIGMSILGSSQGMLLQKIMPFDKRKLFFKTSVLLTAIPLLIGIVIGSFIADSSFVLLFKVLFGLLVGIVTPLYLGVVFASQKNNIQG
ncbi:MAG: hypothetical protein ACQESC_02380 [Nanobdellota archaeon]